MIYGARPNSLHPIVVSSGDQSARLTIGKAQEFLESNLGFVQAYPPDETRFIAVMLRSNDCIAAGVIRLASQVGTIESLATLKPE